MGKQLKLELIDVREYETPKFADKDFIVVKTINNTKYVMGQNLTTTAVDDLCSIEWWTITIRRAINADFNKGLL